MVLVACPQQEEHTSKGYYTYSRPEVRALIPTAARTILDVGCGEGALGKALKQERAVEITGVEIVPAAAAQAREALDKVVTGDIEDMANDLPAGYYDCIILADVLEHLSNPRRVMTLLKRCLKRDGAVVLSIPNVRHWSVLRALLENKWRYEDAGILDRDHLRFFSKASVRELLESAGFTVIGIRSLRVPGQPGMPDSLRQAVEQELGDGALAEETQDYQYLVMARPTVAEASTAAKAVPAAKQAQAQAAGPILPPPASMPAKGPSSAAPEPPSPAPKLPPSLAPRTQSPSRQRPIVSIVMLTWNQKGLTEMCLRSLEISTKVPYELIVVDNGSTDGTVDFLKSYAAEKVTDKQDNVKLIFNPENVGFARGNNQGLKEARGEYLVLLNNDTVLPNMWLERMLRRFYSDKKAGMVGPRSNYVKPRQFAQPEYSELAEFSKFAEGFYLKNQGKTTVTESLVGFCLTVKREVFAKIGLLEEDYTIGGYEDDDLCIRARRAGYRLLIADDVYVHHFGNASFKANNLDIVSVAQQNRGKFIDRWGLKPRIAYMMRWTALSGGTLVAFRQINALVELGYEVRVVSLEGKPGYFDLKAEVEQVGAFETLPPLDDDIVVVFSALDIPIIAPKCRGKLVHLCQGYESYHYGPTLDDVMAEKPQMDRYHSIPCARVVVSEHLKELFQTRFRQKTFLVPNWVDVGRGAAQRTTWPGALKDANVLFVGRPAVAKGFNDFAGAVRIVRSQHPGTVMHVAVPFPPPASQEELEKLLGKPAVLHCGLSRTEMEELYRSADILVAPSWYEGFGLPALEAMACGTPVVTADNPGVREFCKDGENALVVPVAQARKLADAIRRLIEDEDLRIRLSKAGPGTALRYSEDASVQALQQAMDTVFRWEVVPPDYRAEASDTAKRVRHGLTSVVILTLNQADYTRKCLESLFAQTDDPFELIVVDNGSKDGTWPYLKSVRKKHGNVRLIRNAENMGFAFGCNQGIFVSEGEYVVLLNNDTIATREWLKRLKRTLNAVTGAGLAGPVSNYVNGDQLVETGDLRTLDQIQGFAGDLSIHKAGQVTEVNRLVGFCLMVKREVFDRVGVFDTGFPIGNFEDDDLCVRARLAGYRCVIARDVFIYHFGGRSFTGNHIDYNTQMQANQQRFVRKWAALIQAGGGSVPEAAGATGEADRGNDVLRNGVPGNGGNSSALESRGLAHFQAGEFEEALTLFEAVLQRRPGEPDAAYNAALCCLKTGDNRRARRYLNSLLGGASGATAAEVNNLLGVSFVQEEDFHAAVGCFERAIELDPLLKDAVENLRYCRQKMR
jgi:GT2 family glycosyltransferase/2-polyprenyl-3-methyl-5-hydroxy-6-metoxy-1,4-benzoquinol methylase